MNKELEQAYRRREEASVKVPRAAFVEHMDMFLRALPPNEEMFLGIGKLLADCGALYSLQAGMTKEQFLAWASESYELYSRIVKEAGGEAVVARQIGKYMLEEPPPYNHTRGDSPLTPCPECTR